MVSWKEQQKIIEDSKQYILHPDLTITKNPYKSIVEKIDINYEKIVLCPFCLKSYELWKFPLRKGLRICPSCGTALKLSTLANITSLSRFVKFIFDYRFNGFWSKICLDVKPTTPNARFNEWNNRLYKLGINTEFWELYKAMRGDTGEDEEY